MSNIYEPQRFYDNSNIPIDLQKSMEGKYFIGQTENLQFGDETYAWAGLINPVNSKSNIYVNVFTITNLSNKEFISQIWLNSDMFEKSYMSKEVSTTNTSLYPVPRPKARLLYNDDILETPLGGVNIFDRIISPKSTMKAEENGIFIIAPGSSFILFFKSAIYDAAAIVAYGWWEEKCR